MLSKLLSSFNDVCVVAFELMTDDSVERGERGSVAIVWESNLAKESPKEFLTIQTA